MSLDPGQSGFQRFGFRTRQGRLKVRRLFFGQSSQTARSPMQAIRLQTGPVGLCASAGSKQKKFVIILDSGNFHLISLNYIAALISMGQVEQGRAESSPQKTFHFGGLLSDSTAKMTDEC